MNYSGVINFISARYGSICTTVDYYSKIKDWADWYRGTVPAFHKVKTDNGIRVGIREILTLRMGEAVARDWSSALLNEDFKIVINGSDTDSKDKSSVFVQGTALTGGVLGSNNFTSEMSVLIEKTFAMGTGAVVVTVHGVEVAEDCTIIKSADGNIVLEYIDALGIIPLKSRGSTVIDCAFVSEVRENGKVSYTVSVHKLEEEGYVIYNHIVGEYGAEVDMSKSSVSKVIRTMSKRPMFVLIKPALANNVDFNNPMGVSVFNNSVDILKSIDIAFDSSNLEFVLGQRMLFLDKTLGKTDSEGNVVTPQDAKQNVIMYVSRGQTDVPGDGDGMNIDGLIKDFSPALRIDDHIKSIQENLDLLSLKCGLGVRHYSFTNGSTSKTATEYIGDRQDFVRNAKKHGTLLQSAVKSLVLSILYVGRNFLGVQVNESSKVSVLLTDGILEDDGVVRAQDRADVASGLMSKWEYRVKWYGETEVEAKLRIADATEI